MSVEAKNIMLGILHMEYILISHKFALMQYITEMIVYYLASN